MGTCNRCAVAETIKRRGPGNVVEVINLPFAEGKVAYDIYVANGCFERRSYDHIIWVDGIAYVWVMTIFSEEHSLDEDCNLMRREDPKKVGFPRRRLRAEDAVLNGAGEQTWG